MRLECRHHFQATVDEVTALLTDESATCAKYREMDQPAPLRIDRSADNGTIVVRQHRRVRFPVRDEDRRLVAEAPVVDSVECWEPATSNGVRRSTLELRSPTLPVSVTGTLVLTPSVGGGCDCEVVIDLTSDLPLIGGRILEAVSRGAAELIGAEFQANDSFLRRAHH